MTFLDEFLLSWPTSPPIRIELPNLRVNIPENKNEISTINRHISDISTDKLNFRPKFFAFEFIYLLHLSDQSLLL